MSRQPELPQAFRKAKMAIAASICLYRLTHERNNHEIAAIVTFAADQPRFGGFARAMRPRSSVFIQGHLHFQDTNKFYKK